MPRGKRNVPPAVVNDATETGTKPTEPARKVMPHWMKFKEGGTACSECGAMLTMDGQIKLDCSSFKFCFGCGAPMGGDAGATT